MKYLDKYLLSDKEVIILLMQKRVIYYLRHKRKPLSFLQFKKLCPSYYEFSFKYLALQEDLNSGKCKLLIRHNHIYVTWNEIS